MIASASTAAHRRSGSSPTVSTYTRRKAANVAASSRFQAVLRATYSDLDGFETRKARSYSTHEDALRALSLSSSSDAAEWADAKVQCAIASARCLTKALRTPARKRAEMVQSP